MTEGDSVCVCVRVGVGLAWHPKSQQGRAATDVRTLLQLITIVNRCLRVCLCVCLSVCVCVCVCVCV